ncbi:MAG: hypothetical protein ACAI43_14040 [Phycisphaerae bacterium]|nr:hypothetical protein [Tepidisphaeraceae bacterium]
MTRTLLLALAVALSLPTRAADAPQAGLYEQIVEQYMTGKWEDLDALLKSRVKEFNALPAPQKLDVTYVKQSLAESRPAWWNTVKPGKKVNFRATVWTRTMDLTFDPAMKNSVETKSNGFRVDISVQWPAADMDSAANGEHGFTKGEIVNLGVFSTLGMAAAWGAVPQSSLMNLTEKDKTMLFRGLDFRGNIAGVYYGTPRARHWGVWLYMHSYMGKYDKMSIVNGRKAVATAVMMEVLANPKKYPSFPLPDSLDADDAEEKLILAVHKPLEKKGWTFAEDRSLREALKSFNTANEAVVKSGGLVKLPQTLTMHLDPETDKPLQTKRDAWFKKAFDAAKAAK